jgi:uncharacterized protein YjbI with pentapeptide repeats/lipoprotein-anchoring transpeptidase ErfK/SrfK
VLAASERELGGKCGAPINLKSAHLQEAVFRFATLRAANLQAADLARADLVHARLHRADFREANLQGAALDHADLSGALLRQADLRGASLRFATLEGAGLEAADLSRADLAHARLAHANLAGATLSGAVLDYADFAGANLSQADFRGARLHNVRNLSPSQLEQCLGDAATILPAHLRGCVPWSAVGDEPQVPFLDPAEFWWLQSRRDLRRRAFHGPTARIAGAFLIGTMAATGFVTETAHEILSGSPAEAQKSVTPILSMLPPTHVQASPPNVPAAATLEETAPPNLPPRWGELTLPTAPTAPIIDAVTDDVPTESPRPVGETVPQIFAATEVHMAKDAQEALVALAAADELAPLDYGSVIAPTTEPVTVATAPANLIPLKAGQNAVPEVRTRTPKLPVLALRKPPRLSAIRQALVRVPSVRAFGDPKAQPPAIAAPSAPEPLMLVVSLDAQKLDIYRGVNHVASAKISSGMPGYETRTGVFSILEKKRRHHSNLYSGAPMPFMQRLTRSGTALHAGAIPGYPASHGCVRLPYSFAPKLFEMTSVGENVVVTRSRPVPKPIEHPNLFELSPSKPQLAMAADASALSHKLSDAAGASRAGEDHEAAFRSDEPLRMLVTRRTAHDRVIAVQYILADMGYLQRQNFTGKLGTATRNAIRTFQSTNGLTETGAFTDELVKQVYDAAGKTAPPEGHLFVRQRFKSVLDLPISFRDPEVSLGTHVFTMVRREGNEARPKWVAVSLEGDAANVLDRIAIPDDVRRSIAPRLTPGSTLIVADRSEYSAILPEGDDFLVASGEQVSGAEAKVEQATAVPVATPVKVKHAKPRAAKARQAAKPRIYTSYRREIRRRYISRPSPFGLPYMFGR